jgi:hypothetical protein
VCRPLTRVNAEQASKRTMRRPTLPLKVPVEPNDLIDVTEAKAVPPNAEFVLVAAFNPPMPEGKFLRTWGALSVVIEYDGGKVRHAYL